MRQFVVDNVGIFFVLACTAVFIVFALLTRSSGVVVKDPPTHICSDCGTKHSRVTKARAGWTFLFFPLNIVVAEKKTQPCPECSGRLIPIDSPQGKKQTLS